MFLRPLPELSSVPSSQQPSADSVGSTENADLPPLSGVFTSATVPESLVAKPLGQGIPGWSPTRVATNNGKVDLTADDARGTAMAQELEPVILQGDTKEVCVCMCLTCVRGFWDHGCCFASSLTAVHTASADILFPSVFFCPSNSF